MTKERRDGIQRLGTPDASRAVEAELFDVRAVASMLGCSPRHVYRLFDAGRLPRPVRLGSLVRWRRAELQAWIETGCQPLSASVARGRKGGSRG